MININQLNQNNNYSFGKPNVENIFSTLLLRQSNTTTGEVGKIIPILVREMQPNQQINVLQSLNIQFTPLVSNLLHQVGGEINHYFVPYRILWDKWETFITGGETGVEEPPLPNYTLKDVISFIGDKLQKLKKTEYEEFLEICKKYILKTNYEIETIEKFNKYKEQATKALLQTNWDYLGMPLGEYLLFFLAENKNNLKRTQFNTNAIKKLEFGEITPEQIKYFENEDNFDINKLNFMAINKIYNDWVRVMDWEPEKKLDELEANTANWNWDYFTRARRYQLRGAMPTIPVNILHTHKFNIKLQDGNNNIINGINTADRIGITLKDNFVTTEEDTPQGIQLAPAKSIQFSVEKSPNQQARLEFDDIMTAAALMSYYSTNAKIKPRYSEQLLARWNVRIQDARVQQAEYLGTEYIEITSQGIINTSDKQGEITGQLWGNGQAMQGFYRAQEHGVFISELIIKPSNVYEQGINELYKHQNKFDYATPEFVNLPDVPIKKREIDPLATDEVLGYKSIYDEYRTSTNLVTGLVRPSVNAGLGSYTLARNIQARGTNFNFGRIVKCIPDMERVKQFIDQPDFILIVVNEIKTIIPLPYQSTPEMAL
jgi:capsid protein (F protein)|nr:MAG TPA: Major capsid protein [Microviridae sp.]